MYTKKCHNEAMQNMHVPSKRPPRCSNAPYAVFFGNLQLDWVHIAKYIL